MCPGVPFHKICILNPLFASDYLLIRHPTPDKPSQMIEALFPPLGDHDKTCEKELNRAVSGNAESWSRSISLFVRIIRRIEAG